MQSKFYLAENITHVTSSIGISVYPDDAKNANALLKSADIAMYRAKDLGRNGYQFYTQQMNDTLQRERWIEAGLRLALNKGQFQLNYQPQVKLGENKIISCEALIRWSVNGTMISPAEFIPVAEKTGLINQITDWVTQEACQQQSSWLKKGLEPIRVDLNISGKDFLSGDFFTTISQALEQNQLSPEHIGIELTENILIDSSDSMLKSLQQLKASGMHISIDNFGTGYSSLSYLKRFPVTTLKIDQSFVRDATTDKDDRAIMEAIVAIGHRLELSVLVEGVETEEQAQLCREIGCDIAQGYLFARPMPAIELEALLTAKAS